MSFEKFKQGLVKARNRVATNYYQHAILQHIAADNLLTRLLNIRLQPKSILNLGVADSYAVTSLQKFYPDALLVNYDCAELLLAHYKTSHTTYVIGDALSLPFQAQQFDLIFANQYFPFLTSNSDWFIELRRILCSDGLLLFSTLGPDTLIELKGELPDAEQTHFHSYIDMHHLGDALLQQGFYDPVVDREMIEIDYPDLATLHQDLKGTAMQNLSGEAVYLSRHSQLYQTIKKINHPFTVSFEIIFGHALRAPQSMTNNEISVSVDSLRHSLNSKGHQ